MKNRYGVDARYHTGKLSQIVRDIDNYTPDELARSLLRLANVADAGVINEPEFTKPVKVKPLVWQDGRPYADACSCEVQFGFINIYSYIVDGIKKYTVGASFQPSRWGAATSMEEAKELAQEHYGKLILESIE